MLSPWKWALLSTLLLLAVQVRLQHLDERLYFWIATSWTAPQTPGPSLGLADYRVRLEAKPLAGMRNLSGLSYDERRGQLWAVLNNPEELLALSTDGELLARYPLSGFSDVEGVTYLGDDLLLLAEERQQALVPVPVPVAAGALFREDYRALRLGIGDGGNQGFEGVGYDRAGDRLFVVKEHSPRKLYEIRGLKTSLQGAFDLEVIDREAWIGDKLFARDLSSVHYDADTGHLLLLSDESQLLMELDGEGRLVDFRSLLAGFAGLRGSVPQGEGMTLDAQGNLYLVSEPNLFYRFQRD